MFAFKSQKALLLKTNESYYTLNLTNKQIWKNQLQQLTIFNNSLNKENSFLFDLDSFPVVFNSGVSSTSTSHKDDFVPGTFVPLSGVSVSRIASGLAVSGYRIISSKFYIIKGEVVTLAIEKALHIPGLPTRLITPQQICQQYGKTTNFTVDTNSVKLQLMVKLSIYHAILPPIYLLYAWNRT